MGRTWDVSVFLFFLYFITTNSVWDVWDAFYLNSVISYYCQLVVSVENGLWVYRDYCPKRPERPVNVFFIFSKHRDQKMNLFPEEDIEQPKSRKMTWKEKYYEVIASARWKKIRQRFINKANGTCPKCGWKKESWDKSRTLDLHHKTYERLGNERDSDLELVCSVCHAKADIDRAAKNRREAEIKRSIALDNARFDGWARKVYGDDYYDEDGDKYRRYADWAERQEW